MMEMWLLGLVGAGVLAGVLFFDDDDDDSDVGQNIEWDGEREIDGGDGNDTLTAFDDGGSSADGIADIDEIDLGGGDDTATVVADVGEIDMGDGNDSLVFGESDYVRAFDRIALGDGDDVAVIQGSGPYGVGNIVDGGAGNDSIDVIGVTDVDGGSGEDTITGELMGNAHGGAGDDLLSVERPINSDGSAHMHGDAGNDTLQAAVTLGDTDYPMDVGSWVQMTGGEGADSFELAVKLGEMTQAEYDQLEADVGFIAEENLPQIRDFDPAEDIITVDVDTSGATVDREVTISDYEQKADPDGGYVTTVTLHVPAQGGMAEGSTTLTIHSLVTFDLADLNITVDGNPLT